MPQYLYQLSYKSESMKAQMADPQDRLMSAAAPVAEAVGGKLLGGGFSFGEYDAMIFFEAPDDESAAAIAVAVSAGGAIRCAQTTKLLSGEQWVAVLTKAGAVAKTYKPSK